MDLGSSKKGHYKAHNDEAIEIGNSPCPSPGTAVPFRPYTLVDIFRRHVRSRQVEEQWNYDSGDREMLPELLRASTRRMTAIGVSLGEMTLHEKQPYCSKQTPIFTGDETVCRGCLQCTECGGVFQKSSAANTKKSGAFSVNPYYSRTALWVCFAALVIAMWWLVVGGYRRASQHATRPRFFGFGAFALANAVLGKHHG
jgi:hypothetical protein